MKALRPLLVSLYHEGGAEQITILDENHKPLLGVGGDRAKIIKIFEGCSDTVLLPVLVKRRKIHQILFHLKHKEVNEFNIVLMDFYATVNIPEINPDEEKNLILKYYRV